MIYLLGSIFFASVIFLIFKIFERKKVQNFQAIILNYFTAGIFGFLLADAPQISEMISKDWFFYALGIGFGFIIIFNLMALTTQKLGASAAAVTVKMSVAIPVVVAYFLYSEAMDVLKITGILLALLGIFLASRSKSRKNAANKWLLLLPAALFVGGGILDSLLKYTENRFIGDNSSEVMLLTPTIFLSAAFFGLLLFLIRSAFKRSNFSVQKKDVGYGIALGLINYGSIFCLISALNYGNWESSVVFPVNNVGIVIVTALSSVFFFNEKLSKINKFGIIVSVFAILLIALS